MGRDFQGECMSLVGVGMLTVLCLRPVPVYVTVCDYFENCGVGITRPPAVPWVVHGSKEGAVLLLPVSG